MNWKILIYISLFLLAGCQNKMNNETVTTNNLLNVPLHFPVNLKKIDGKKIVSTIQYQLLINLNLTLLEYDKDANLNTLLAEDYDIKENVIVFQIKKNVKTIGGHEIKAIDAEISLKRLIKSDDGSHSRLAELLCTEDNVKSSNDCPGISSSGYELTMVARKKSYIPFILSLLTNADNVIMPLTALDSPTSHSHIVNFKETSGPYYIDQNVEDTAVDYFKLTLNKKHFLNSGKIAGEINYTLADFNMLVLDNKKLKSNFNYIHNVAGLKLSQVKDLQENDKTIKIHPTLLLKNTMVFSTKKGRQDLTEKQLMFYELLIRDTLLNSKIHYPNIAEQQVEYFPVASEGNLTSEQLAKITEEYKSVANLQMKLSSNVRVGLYKLHYERYREQLEKLDGISVLLIKDYPLDKNPDKVDMFIDTIDSSFTESLDLLQYNKTFGIFDITDEDMKNYIDAESKEVRIKQLQNIHFKSLMNAHFVNIGAAPYYTILSKEWSAEPSKIFVGFPAWKITRKI